MNLGRCEWGFSMSPKDKRRERERERSCTGKIKFQTLDGAEAAARSYRRTYGGFIIAYHCKFCGLFHFGHAPYRIRQSIRDKARNKMRR